MKKLFLMIMVIGLSLLSINSLYAAEIISYPPGTPGGNLNTFQMNLAGLLGGTSIHQTATQIWWEDPTTGLTVYKVESGKQTIYHSYPNIWSEADISGATMYDTSGNVILTTATPAGLWGLNIAGGDVNTLQKNSAGIFAGTSIYSTSTQTWIQDAFTGATVYKVEGGKQTAYYSTGVTAHEINTSGATYYDTSGNVIMTTAVPAGLWGLEFNTVEAGVSPYLINDADGNISGVMLKRVHLIPQPGTTVSRNLVLPSINATSGATANFLYSDYGAGVTIASPAGTSIYVMDGKKHISGNTIWCAPGSPGSKIYVLSGVSTDGTYFVDVQVSGTSWQLTTKTTGSPQIVGNTWIQ